MMVFAIGVCTGLVSRRGDRGPRGSGGQRACASLADKSFVLLTENAFFLSFFFKYNPDTFLYFSIYEMKVSHATLMSFKALEVLLKTCPLLCGPIR